MEAIDGHVRFRSVRCSRSFILPGNAMSEEKLPFAVMPIEAFFDRRLTLTQLRVLGALLSFRNRSTGTVFPGRAAIAARTGLPLTKISTTTTELVALGWLRKRGCGGRSSTCTYEVTTPVELTRAVLVAIAVNDTQRTETLPETGTVSDPGTVPDTVTPAIPVQADADRETPDAAAIGTPSVTESDTATTQTVTESRIRELQTVTDSITGTVTESGTKPSPKRGRAKKRPGTDQGTEQSTAGPAASDHGTRLAVSELPSDWCGWVQHERPELDPSQTWAKFHDYWTAQAGARGRKRDWFAAWRFWVRNEYVDSHRRSGNGTHGSTHERRQRIHDQIRENVLRHVEEMD
jgi:hypothetical protein